VPVDTHKPVVTPVPVVPSTFSKSKNNIIIYQHITNIIQKFKYTQKHSYLHMENLIRNLKYITQNHDFYKNLIYTRNHLHNHYNIMFKELYQLRKDFNTNNQYINNNDAYDYNNDNYDNDENDDSDDNYDNDDNDDNIYYDDDNDNDEYEKYKIPPFVQSMKILDKYIQQIEKNIQFIKGKYKYTFIKILFKLKFQYRQDTVRLILYWINRFGNNQ
jgi:hypothetical protein